MLHRFQDQALKARLILRLASWQKHVLREEPPTLPIEHNPIAVLLIAEKDVIQPTREIRHRAQQPVPEDLARALREVWRCRATGKQMRVPDDRLQLPQRRLHGLEVRGRNSPTELGHQRRSAFFSIDMIAGVSFKKAHALVHVVRGKSGTATHWVGTFTFSHTRTPRPSPPSIGLFMRAVVIVRMFPSSLKNRTWSVPVQASFQEMST